MFNPEMFKHLNYSMARQLENSTNPQTMSSEICKATHFECKRLFTLTDFTLFKRVKLHPYVQDRRAKRRKGLRWHFSLCRLEHDPFCRLCCFPVGCLVYVHLCHEIHGCVRAEGRWSACLLHLKRDRISQRSHRVTPKKYSCEGSDESLFLRTDPNYH